MEDDMATTRTRKATAPRCDGTVTLADGRTWGAHRLASGEVYANPMSVNRIVGYAVVRCDDTLAATYRHAES
jgi:hypothetical protein